MCPHQGPYGCELRVAELERRLRMDSANSSVPPSKEDIAAKARRKAALRESQRERSKDRRPGGQPGHRGSGLAPAPDPDRTARADSSGAVPILRREPGRSAARARRVGAGVGHPAGPSGEGALAAAEAALCWVRHGDHR